VALPDRGERRGEPPSQAGDGKRASRRLRPADPAPSAEDIVIADVTLGTAWRGLRAAEREVLTLALVEDLAPAQLAVALGVSVNAASIRLHRARTKLAALLSN
jgi:RNA polymerase sigma-70 factor (ECF subfamily)